MTILNSKSPRALSFLVAGILTIYGCGDSHSIQHSERALTDPVPVAEEQAHPEVEVIGHSARQSGYARFPTADIAAFARHIRATRRYQDMIARQERIASEGFPPIAVAESPLPEGQLAIIRFGQPAPLPRYVTVFREHFNDEVIQRALNAEMSYRMKYDDNSAVTLALYDDRIDVNSSLLGKRSVWLRHIASSHQRIDEQTRQLVARLPYIEPRQLPGIGRVRVVESK